MEITSNYKESISQYLPVTCVPSEHPVALVPLITDELGRFFSKCWSGVSQGCNRSILLK